MRRKNIGKNKNTMKLPFGRGAATSADEYFVKPVIRLLYYTNSCNTRAGHI